MKVRHVSVNPYHVQGTSVIVAVTLMFPNFVSRVAQPDAQECLYLNASPAEP